MFEFDWSEDFKVVFRHTPVRLLFQSTRLVVQVAAALKELHLGQNTVILGLNEFISQAGEWGCNVA